jgi:manganese-dependent ADP-ribose/CDP-alcohol diphosphatase
MSTDSTLSPDLAEDAFQYLEKFNPNNVRSNKVDWVAGLTGDEKRFVPYNGGFGEEQRKWLAQELDCDDKVIIASHIPLFPGSCGDSTLLWDYPEVLEILAQSKAKIMAVFSGHDHDGGYKFDEKLKIHYLTLPSPMVCKNKNELSAHGIVDVFEDRLEIKGYGTVKSMSLPF